VVLPWLNTYFLVVTFCSFAACNAAEEDPSGFNVDPELSEKQIKKQKQVTFTSRFET
jgi:hypothetical protein